MTRKQFVQQAAERGMITAGKAAILTGRKPSGKFAAELVKRGIWSETFTDGTKVYSKPEIERKFIRLVKGAAIRPDSEAYIEQRLKDAQAPLRLEEKAGMMICPDEKCIYRKDCPDSKPHKIGTACKVSCWGVKCIPYIEPAKRSDAELLDGVNYAMYGLKRNLDGGREFVHLSVNKAVLWAFDPYAIAQLAREIIRRIDGETVKRSDVQAQIDAALLAYKERIKGAL